MIFTDYFHRQEIWANGLMELFMGLSAFLALRWNPDWTWHTSDEAISDLWWLMCQEISTFYRRPLSSTIYQWYISWWFNLVRRNNKSLKCLNEARMWQKLSKKPGEPQGPDPREEFLRARWSERVAGHSLKSEEKLLFFYCLLLKTGQLWVGLFGGNICHIWNVCPNPFTEKSIS